MTDDKPTTAPNVKAPPKDASQPARPRDSIAVRVVHFLPDRPLQLPGGQSPHYSITANEQFTIELLPALGFFRIAWRPRAGASGTPWERMVPVSWASFERAPS